MRRGIKLTLIIAILSITAGNADAQGWNPFGSKTKASPTQPPSTNPFSLDKLLTIPGLTQPSSRPINQVSMRDRFQQTTQQMWSDTKRAITPPILQTSQQGAGGIWPFSKNAPAPSFKMPTLFPAKTTSTQQGPPPTINSFLSQPRPE